MDSNVRGSLREPLYWAMGMLLVASVSIFFVLYDQGIAAGSVEMELAKTALQVGVVAVFGGLLTHLAARSTRRADERAKEIETTKADRAKQAEAERVERRYREELLKETADRITTSYNRTKRARRKVRALGLDSIAKPTRVAVKTFDECMAEVTDAQLELETIKRDVETSAKAIPSASGIWQKLNDMEGYLSDLNGDYEDARSKVAGDEGHVALTVELSNFVDFIRKGNSNFKDGFAYAHKEARGLINRDLIELTSVRDAEAPTADQPAAPSK